MVAPAGAPTGREGGLVAVLTLVRWPNLLLSAAGVLAGAWWARGEIAVRAPRVAWAAAAAVLIAALVNVVNDLHDVAIDRLAHPRRPLATGVISRRAAWRATSVLTFGALAASAVAGTETLLAITAVVITAAFAYSPQLKRHGLAGNVAVAIVASLPFVYGAYAVGVVRAGLALLAVAVPLHFARELAKDLDDIDADASGGRLTLPLRIGVPRTRLAIAAAVVVHAACVMFLLVPPGWRGLALAPGLLLAVVAASRAGQVRRPGAATLFKLSMLLAMTGLFALR